MKVLLISPKVTEELQVQALMPLNLMYLAACARQAGHTVAIVDLAVSTKSELNRKLLSFRPEVVGITAMTPVITQALSISEEIKKGYPGITIVMGGIHATTVPEEVLSDKNVDFVVIGEGEETFPELLNAIENGLEPSSVEGIAYRKDGRIIRTPPRPFLEDLDRIPFPAWDLIELKRYMLPGHGATMIATRGCPYRCIYCASHLVFGRKIRRRSITNVFEELQSLYSMGCDYVRFYDDTFTASREYTFELCDKIIESGLRGKMSFWTNTRVDRVDEELLKRMRNAGFTDIAFGIESGVDKTLDYMKKGISVLQAENAVKAARKAGFDSVEGFFMINFPCESKEDMERTLEFARKLPVSFFRLSALTPYPGTEAYDICLREGYVQENVLKDYSQFGYLRKVMVRNPNVPEKTVSELIKKGNRDMILRPVWIFEMARRLVKRGNLNSFSRGLVYFSNIFKIGND